MKRKNFTKPMTQITIKVPIEDSDRYGILCMVKETNKSADLARYIQREVNKNKDIIDRVLHERELMAKKG